MGSRRTLLAAGPALLLAARGGRAAGPGGGEILRVSGLIDPSHGPAGVGYDLAALEDLGMVEATTDTPWTREPQPFAGVPLRRLLAAVGARGGVLRAAALNDYAVSIPVGDADEYDVLLATRLRGAPMRVRDRGPIWVVYPGMSSGPEAALLSERWIWQLRRIEVR